MLMANIRCFLLLLATLVSIDAAATNSEKPAGSRGVISLVDKVKGIVPAESIVPEEQTSDDFGFSWEQADEFINKHSKSEIRDAVHQLMIQRAGGKTTPTSFVQTLSGKRVDCQAALDAKSAEKKSWSDCFQENDGMKGPPISENAFATCKKFEPDQVKGNTGSEGSLSHECNGRTGQTTGCCKRDLIAEFCPDDEYYKADKKEAEVIYRKCFDCSCKSFINVPVECKGASSGDAHRLGC